MCFLILIFQMEILRFQDIEWNQGSWILVRFFLYPKPQPLSISFSKTDDGEK